MMESLQLIDRAHSHADACALRSDSGEHSYRELLDRSAYLAAGLLSEVDDLHEACVAYLVPAGFDHITIQWAIWRAGGIAVPLSMSATQPELEYALRDSNSEYVFAPQNLVGRIESLCARHGLRLLIIGDTDASRKKLLPSIASDRRAMILYTSGTTSKPKGVVTTHDNIQSQITTLVDAWKWEATDCIPLFLPLHHIHGIINVMCCALWSGATIEPFPKFDLDSVLARVAAGKYSVFMAVPTIYVKLIQALDSFSENDRDAVVRGFSAMRLMVSGSAALPASVHHRWSDLTQQDLLERYGMTEIGMALSNPYDGERRPGTVGQPLPKVDIRLASENGEVVTIEGESGEIQVRGPGVFLEYWNNPTVTADAFDHGWFCTGDVASLQGAYYRILGRQSVDIIKSGGYKLSALEIEAVLLQHPAIRECAVVGTADNTWGEAVAAAVVLRDGEELDLESLRSWCRDRLSTYKIPKRLMVVVHLPKNAMGKVTKPAVKVLF
jgi:malonyl-CoA/methylmalonyl-CoA synthetase